MNLNKLEDLKIETKKRWEVVRHRLGELKQAGDDFTETFTHTMEKVTEMGVADVPDLVQDAEDHLKWLEQFVTALKVVEGKAQATASHGMEAAIDTVAMQELIKQLGGDLENFQQKDILLKQALNAIEYLVAADDKATGDILNLIGEERVKAWSEGKLGR